MKTFQILTIMVSSVFITLYTTGCAVSMAAKAPTKKDVTVLNVGTERERVVAELGAPVLADVKEGKKVDTFNFVQGYSKGSKAGRAFFHGAADVLTIGLWEVVGTPIEGGMDGTEVQVVVYYDENDLVERVKVYEGHNKLQGVNSDNLPPTEPEEETTKPEDNGDAMNLREIDRESLKLVVADKARVSAPLGN